MKKIISVFKNCQVMKVAIFSLLMLVCASSAFAQTSVKGKVTDDKGNPLTGVSIIVQGTTVGTYSDLDGTYSLVVPARNSKNGVLEFFYMGFKAVKITLDGRAQYNVTLVEDAARLSDVIVVGYGTQKKGSVTGAITQISGKELLKAPTTNISSMLNGKIAGVIGLQQSGQPGADASSIIVRGTGAKYIVDGVERNFNEIDPNDVESVSVLKDASSAAIFGMDASSAIIIKTKRGQRKENKISYKGSYGISSNAVEMKMLDGPGYAYWYNKAREMDGDTPIFTAEHVRMMLNNDPTDGWGNTNWYKETFGVGTSMSHNINSSGGNEKLAYFVSLGMFDQKGNVRNFNYRRYNLRSNIDTKISKNVTLEFNIAGRIEDRKNPGYSANPADWNNIPQQAIRVHPYVPMTIDGIPVSTRTASSYVSPIAASENTGYRNTLTSILETNLALTYKVPYIQGLSFKFMGSYDASFTKSKAFSTPYKTYVANTPTPTTTNISYSLVDDARGNTASLVEGFTYSNDIVTNTSVNYSNVFGKHKVGAIALMETSQTEGNSMGSYGYGFDFYELDELDFAKLADKTKVSGGSSQSRKVGFAGRLNYEFDGKYLLEATLRYDGSYVFSGMMKNKRWAAFPSASAGWVISNEKWFSERFPFVNSLKLKAGIGLTGKTGISPYQDLNTLSIMDNAAVIGGSPVAGVITSKPGNQNLTWEKALHYNLGLESTLWNGLLNVEFDVFYKYAYDILSTIGGSYPDSFGGYFFSTANTNKQDYKGFELSLDHKNSIGDFSYFVSLKTTYTQRRWLKYTDSENTPDYLKVTGSEIGSQMGFIALGLFQSEEEIANSALIPGKPVRVGDIKFLDRNGDGKITYEQDRGYVASSSYPKYVLGLSFDGKWKGFDINFLIQSGLGRDVALTGVYSSGVMDNTSMTKPFYHGGNSPQYLVENSWREDNRNAEFPRLTIVSASSNNAYSSSFWYRNGNYLRLKSAQIGYTIPIKYVKKSGFEDIRVYAEGQNLFTLSQLTKFNIDPEQPGVQNGYYPQQRVFSMGITFTF
ncbi:MAG: TonB-dependent receptor [Bacteroidales bacterium]